MTTLARATRPNRRKAARRLGRFALVLLAGTSLGGCNLLTRLSNVGDEPEFTTNQGLTQQPEYQQVSLPMPSPQAVERQPNSLWRPGSRAFFKDQRASQVGDILTVIVELDEEADFENETILSRENDNDADLNSFLGYEESLDEILPDAVDNEDLIDFGSTSDNTGSGEIEREESITTSIAAIVTQVLPNGNLVIFGRQEIRVNFEIREILVAGVIRPEDISATNTILHDKIAEARIAYGGRGQITDMQQPRYGQQVFDVVFPF